MVATNTALVERARLTEYEIGAFLIINNENAVLLAIAHFASRAQLAKALEAFAKEDIETCPCKRCVMIRSVIDSDTPNTYGIERPA